ncbi:NB-ARC - like 10 [Theobroma cacao]|nr:NB-ARC - like 10 [Theobroma cacao]
MMVKKCGGLPLAIAVLGGLLATKGTMVEWEMVQRNINAHLNNFPQLNDYGNVNGILVLSYNELPFHLKPCFLYIGHYPEDWEISKKELIRLWIAEGFISPSWESREIMLMEEVAERFLEELIDRCLVQVGQRDHTGTGVKTCRIHDLLRDLCVRKVQNENFLEIIQPSWMENDGHVNLTLSMARRIAIHPSKREVFHDVLIKLLSPSREEREQIDKLKENELVERLHDVLKEKQYLVVLDDIWRSEDWNSLKHAFPRGKKGNKILFTTRNKDVALHADPWNSPIELSLLTDDESWKLFQMKAFRRNKTDFHACPEELEMLGREMVKKCGGLPLVIVVLGGLLATKKLPVQWEMVHRNIHAHLNKFQQQDHHYGEVKGILALSYDELPFHLKPCILYLSHYPEDWEISKKELIQLWIAEGFISSSWESEGMLMEDVAEQFLEELINRCLVQVRKRDRTGTGVKTCHIHDLLRDLCAQKAKE